MSPTPSPTSCARTASRSCWRRDAAAGRTRRRRRRLTVKTPDGERTLDGSHLLAAAGRVPNTDRLNPDAAGIDVDKRATFRSNERLETNVPGIYALGDITGGPAFTHISYDDFRILQTNLIEGGSGDEPTAWCPTPSSSIRNWAASA